MTIIVRLFAVLRERAGTDLVELELPDEATVADALKALSRVPAVTGLLDRLPVRMAVNRDYASPQTRLAPDDELALIPPISGGSGPLVAVTELPLELEALAATVSDARAGAIVTFQGVTRGVSRLDYEAYTEMATHRIWLIANDCVVKHGLCAASVEHRVGAVSLGEPSVVVAVSAPHRAEAFSGASEIIDRIKAEVPIWKLEIDSDGTARRVAGTPAPDTEAQYAGQRDATPRGGPR
jgi:molybdopterin converting factor subunit 1